MIANRNQIARWATAVVTDRPKMFVVNSSSPAYVSGYRARLANCHRVLANPSGEQELIDWCAGWDAAAATLKGGVA